MNSNQGRSSNSKSGSLNTFDFDLGLGSTRPRSLNDQKSQTFSASYSSASYAYSSAQSKPNSTTSSWTHQPGKPSWTHKPSVAAPASQSGGLGSLSGPTSMVGDIFGKSWNSSTASSNTVSGVGIVNKNPNLFGDLVSSAIGQNKGSSNVPLRNASPAANKSSFSMGGMADSLPKTSEPTKSGGSWGSSGSFGSHTSGYNANNAGSNVNLVGNNSRSANLGGPSLKNTSGSGGVSGMGSKKDPFGSLVDFGSKTSGGINSAAAGSDKSSFGDDAFGDFQNASKTSGSSFPSSAFGTSDNISVGSTAGFSDAKTASFGFSNTPNQPSVHSSNVDDFDSLFASTAASSGEAAKGSAVFENQFSGADDWGMDSEFAGGDDASGTTELDGLPPPPAGVSASSAKNKGLDNHKQGQYADAIKWLSWAVILLEKAGDDAGAMEVLSCRASCYKEVGEYKKAVADCTKVLEQDGSNASVLVQRALLYESMEKYRLGADDLRTVMKIDPGNRVARSTIHRLNKMAD